MMRGCWGQYGSGKTLWLAAMGNESSGRSKLYCNMQNLDLDYCLLESADDFDLIPEDSTRKTILIDELHQYADSWSYDALSKKLAKFAAQHRKYHCDIYYTVQFMDQIINRLRWFTVDLYSPQLFIWRDMGKPLFLNMQHYIPTGKDEFSYVNDVMFPLFTADGRFICDLYDTDEVIQEMEDPSVLLVRQVMDKYRSVDLVGQTPREGTDRRKAFKARLILDDGIPSALAGQIVNRLAFQEMTF